MNTIKIIGVLLVIAGLYLNYTGNYIYRWDEALLFSEPDNTSAGSGGYISELDLYYSELILGAHSMRCVGDYCYIAGLSDDGEDLFVAMDIRDIQNPIAISTIREGRGH